MSRRDGRRAIPGPSAGFSSCMTYRYWLTRSWKPVGRTLVIIGLNPSTADEVSNDPTIRRCIAFAKAWDFSSLTMLNLFAFRATEPKAMKLAEDPVGPLCDGTLLEWTLRADTILAAWGTHGSYRGRDEEVIALLKGRRVPLCCLGLTKNAHPKHPLYLPGSVLPVPFRPDTLPTI